MRPKHFWNVKETGLGESVYRHYYSYTTYLRNVNYRKEKDPSSLHSESGLSHKIIKKGDYYK